MLPYGIAEICMFMANSWSEIEWDLLVTVSGALLTLAEIPVLRTNVSPYSVLCLYSNDVHNLTEASTSPSSTPLLSLTSPF